MSSSNYSISYPGNPPNVSTNNVNVSTLSGIVSYDPNGAVSREILNTPCSTPFSQAQSISLFSLTNDIYVNSSTIIYIPYIYYTFNLNFVTSTCFKLIFSLPSQYISGMMSGTTITKPAIKTMKVMVTKVIKTMKVMVTKVMVIIH